MAWLQSCMTKAVKNYLLVLGEGKWKTGLELQEIEHIENTITIGLKAYLLGRKLDHSFTVVVWQNCENLKDLPYFCA